MYLGRGLILAIGKFDKSHAEIRPWVTPERCFVDFVVCAHDCGSGLNLVLVHFLESAANDMRPIGVYWMIGRDQFSLNKDALRNAEAIDMDEFAACHPAQADTDTDFTLLFIKAR